MADVAELRKEVTKYIEEKKEHFDSIRWGRHRIEEVLKKKKHSDDELIPLHHKIKTKSKEEVYQELKHNFRFAWKSPGYANSEFGSVPALKASVLSVWDRERALMPERSYKAPKGFRGFKTTYVPEEFGEPSEKLVPERYKKQLEVIKADYDDRVMRPSKYQPLKEDILIDNLFNKQRERGWRLVNSMQQKDFGNDKHATFEFEIMTRTGFHKPPK